MFILYSTRMKEQLLKHRTLAYACLALVLLSILARPVYRLLSEKAPTDLSMPVQTIRVKTVAITRSVQTVGVFEPTKMLSLKTAVAGRIATLHVEPGTWVEQGHLLAEIIGAPPIKAPFAGTVGDWLVKIGEYVDAGTAIIHLVDTEDLWISYKLPEYYASDLALGQSVVSKVRTPTETDQILEGTLIFIAPIVDPKTHTIAMKARLKNQHHEVWPGMYAQVDQQLNTINDALVIPEFCLIQTLEGYEVLMIVEGKLQKRSVRIGARQKGRVQIQAGLNVGDAVVLTRNYSLQEGLSVVAEDWTGDW